MEAFENMNKKTKIILSLVGISSVVIPAMLLLFVSGGTEKIPEIDSAKRQIDQGNIDNVKKSVPATSSPVIVATPSPVATPSSTQVPGGEATPTPR